MSREIDALGSRAATGRSERSLFVHAPKRLGTKLISIIIGTKKFRLVSRSAQFGNRRSNLHHLPLVSRCGSASPQTPISTRVRALYATKGLPLRPTYLRFWRNGDYVVVIRYRRMLREYWRYYGRDLPQVPGGTV